MARKRMTENFFLAGKGIKEGVRNKEFFPRKKKRESRRKKEEEVQRAEEC